MTQNIVYNCDCVEAMKQMDDNAFDLAIVDPVYGDVTNGGYMKNAATGVAKVKDYHISLWRQEKNGDEYFEQLFRVSKNQIIFGGNYFTTSIKKDSQCWIVWDKRHPEGVGFADCELAWTSFNSATRIFRFRWNGMLQEDPKNKEMRIHPTQKPVALYKWILSNYARKGDRILDTHLGSGSSRIACHDLGFDFVGFEIDKQYFKEQEKRYQEHVAQVTLFDEIDQQQANMEIDYDVTD